MAAIAGCDMDMHSMTYAKHLVDLVNEGEVDIALIDDAVRRILTKKFELGLFDDPYCYNNRVYIRTPLAPLKTSTASGLSMKL